MNEKQVYSLFVNEGCGEVIQGVLLLDQSSGFQKKWNQKCLRQGQNMEERVMFIFVKFVVFGFLVYKFSIRVVHAYGQDNKQRMFICLT